jgi:hypothetical protein
LAVAAPASCVNFRIGRSCTVNLFGISTTLENITFLVSIFVVGKEEIGKRKVVIGLLGGTTLERRKVGDIGITRIYVGVKAVSL